MTKAQVRMNSIHHNIEDIAWNKNHTITAQQIVDEITRNINLKYKELER